MPEKTPNWMLIDADWLSEQLKESRLHAAVYKKDTDAGRFKAFLEAYEHLKPLTELDNLSWHDADEHSPIVDEFERYQHVIAVINGEVTTDVIYDKERNCFQYNADTVYRAALNVTHWMYIPKPPKAELDKVGRGKDESGSCEWCGTEKENPNGLCRECGRFPSPSNYR